MRLFFRITILLTLTFVLSFLQGCRKEKTYKIGVSQCSQDDWRAKMNDEINREIMLHDDAVVEIRSADDDNARQIADIEYFADNDFDIIIVAPNEAEALTPAIKKVYESGIPVIVFDRDIIGDSYTARITVDNEQMGRSAARYARHLAGDGAKAIEIYGLRGSTPAEGRHKGFADVFTAEGGTLLASEAADWNKEDAVPVVDSLLDVYDDVDIIYAHNDRMAIGASEAVRSKGREGIRIIGIDAAPQIGIRAVADSVIDATFLYPTEGYRLVRTALAILKGEKYDRETVLPLSSAVDQSNADILLLQNESLKEETGKLKILKGKIDDYWAQHDSQKILFYAALAIIVLLCGVVFLVLNAYWQHKRHQAMLLQKNRMLEEERDKQKRLNEQLQEAIQSKLVFFTNVSHDLRTPLTLIAEPVAQVSEADNLTPRQRSLMKIADKNVRILRRLINQILDFRKYENDRLTLSLTETDLGAAVREWTESFKTVARKRHITLTLSESDASTEPAVLAVDIEKIERVFFNLLSNAFKYSPDNSSITVSCRREGDNVILSVADTGRGISQRDLGNIFDRFYQVDRVHPNGSGIGLSLSKAFVELHGGTISVDSTPDKGSVFTVTLPVRHTDECAAARPASTITTREVETELSPIDSETAFDDGKPLILVIDDNADIRQLMRELLSDSYNVLTASGGHEGIRKAMKYVPDLIICDVMMPGIDGLECCRELKSEVSTSHIPVLMLTACSMDEQKVQGFDSGADGYMSKPFSNEVLQALCRSLISNRRIIRDLWETSGGGVKPKTPDSGREKPTSDIDNDFYNRFLKILQEQAGNSDLSVDDIASRMGLERSQFYRKIKALTNFSPMELIRDYRLKTARQLLITTEKSVSEIAYETGFSTPAYFTKCFREAFGETPSSLRSKYKTK